MNALPRWFAAASAVALMLLAAPAVRSEVVPVDDQEFGRRATRDIAALLDRKQLTPYAELKKQLDRRVASVPLALTAPAAAALDGAAIYARARAGVLVMCQPYKCGKCNQWHVNFSTAFAVTADGVIAANYHSMKSTNTEAMVVATADGRLYPVREVLAASAEDDAVLLRTDARNLVPLPLSADEPVGRPVSVVSHPDRQFFVMTRGHVSRYYVERGPSQAASTRMAITADYAKGSSGGPVFNEAGAVVGMVASTHSIYYEDHDGKQENLQMVIKSCVPARAILRLAGRR